MPSHPETQPAGRFAYPARRRHFRLRVIRSLMPYPGGKHGPGVYQQIINQLPPHRVYIEPFLGGGAVLLKKAPAIVNVGIDADAAAVRRIWPRLRERMPTEIADPAIADYVARELARLFPPSRPGQRTIRSSGPVFAAVGDALDFLEGYKFTGCELVYCDPPYLHETRNTKRMYGRFELDDQAHLRLLAILRRIETNVVLSGYYSSLYGKELKNWRVHSFGTSNRAGQRTTETLWMNYSPPPELHDYRYLGSDRRKRQDIQRKQRRWVDRLRRMPELEREALRGAIAEAWGS